MLIPQQLTVDILGPREPKLIRWVAVMARHPDEGAAVVRFSDSYFHWLEDQLFVIQDFLYAGMDFRGDPTWFFHRENNGTTEVLLFSQVF